MPYQIILMSTVPWYFLIPMIQEILVPEDYVHVDLYTLCLFEPICPCLKTILFDWRRAQSFCSIALCVIRHTYQ